jgi:tripartite-type tricarboxylate transporter receptor subunit TctC
MKSNGLRNAAVGRPRGRNAAAATVAAVMLLGLPAKAANFPVKPVRMYVGAGTGGGVDVTARMVADKLTELLKQPVIVDNRPGAGGNIAAALVAKAPADGYSILMGTIAPLAINPSLYPKLPFDPARDFAPISRTADSTNVLVVHPSLPVKSINDLIALAKARPGDLTYGSPLIGSAGHLAGELFSSMAGIRMVHVPYGSGPRTMMDLIAGELQLIFATAITSTPHIKSGRIRALAVTTANRSPLLPALPTIHEAGLPGFEVNNWYGLVAPAGTPGDVVQLLNHQVVALLNLRDIRDFMLNQGLTPAPSTPEAFGDYIKSEMAKWSRVVRESGAKAN